MTAKKLHRLSFSLVGAAWFSLFAVDAQAYRVLEKDGVTVGWPPGTQINFELAEHYPDSLSADTVLSQVSAAMQLWNAQTTCGAPPLVLSGKAAQVQSGDGKNTITWVDANWTATTSTAASAPGVTDIRIGQDEQGRYRILEADVYLNAEHFHWSTELLTAAVNSSQQTQYVSEVLAHEFGHALGLDHPCEFEETANTPNCASGTEFSSSLMFPSPQYTAPALDNDDVGGLCHLYRQSDPCPNGEPICGGTGSATVDGSSFVLPIPQGGECNNHAQCEPFLACIGGTCELGTGAPGDACKVNGQCANGACINGGCRATCSDQEPCLYLNQQCDATTSTCGNTLRIFGKKCDEADDCASAQCVVDEGAVGYCTKECGNDEDCPSGWGCSELDGLNVCVRRKSSDGGCAMARVPQDNSWTRVATLLLGLGLVGLWIRRERRTGED